MDYKKDIASLYEEILMEDYQSSSTQALKILQGSTQEDNIDYTPITSARVDVWLEEDDDTGDTIVRIDSIEVPKSKRGKGEGTKEVANIIKWGKKNGATSIVVESERKAIPFWKKLGFNIFDQGSEVSTGVLKIDSDTDGV